MSLYVPLLVCECGKKYKMTAWAVRHVDKTGHKFPEKWEEVKTGPVFNKDAIVLIHEKGVPGVRDTFL